MSPDRPVLAFFDVDETLIAMKSPFALLRHLLAEQGDVDGDRYEATVAPLREMAAAGAAPVEVVGRFYELFAGVAWERLLADGRRWWAGQRDAGPPFVADTLAALRHHQDQGHVVVAVSGSWEATLRPIADELGVAHLRCTRPELAGDGTLTGRIAHAMFGPAKDVAVRETLAEFGADPAECHAYGDDRGDLGMLTMVGAATVVGDHPVMTAEAARRGWPVLSAATVEGRPRCPV